MRFNNIPNYWHCTKSKFLKLHYVATKFQLVFTHNWIWHHTSIFSFSLGTLSLAIWHSGLSSRVIIYRYLSHVCPSVVIAKRAKSSLENWYFIFNCYEDTNVSRIDSLLIENVIKFERFRRKRSRLPTYCVFCDQSALLQLCTSGQLSRNISLHFYLSLFLFLFRFARMFFSFSFYHFYWTPTTVIEVDQGLWTRCHSVGRKCHGRSSCAGSRLLELFHALSRAQLES